MGSGKLLQVQLANPLAGFAVAWMAFHLRHKAFDIWVIAVF